MQMIMTLKKHRKMTPNVQCKPKTCITWSQNVFGHHPSLLRKSGWGYWQMMKKEIRPYNFYCTHLEPLVDLLSSLAISRFFLFSLQSFFFFVVNWQDSMEKGENTRKWDKRTWKKKVFWYKMPWLFFFVFVSFCGLLILPINNYFS